jgi:hypothetical protein
MYICDIGCLFHFAVTPSHKIGTGEMTSGEVQRSTSLAAQVASNPQIDTRRPWPGSTHRLESRRFLLCIHGALPWGTHSTPQRWE